MKADWLWIGQVAMAALVNLAYAFALGSTLYGAWLEKDARSAVAPARPAWLRAQRSLRTASLVLVIALVMWLLYESASISGQSLPASFGVVPTVLSQTHVGHAWSVAFGGALVVLFAAFAGASPLRDGVLWLALIAVAAGRAGLGHAADAGFASAALGLNTLHVLSASAWSGIVMAGGLAVLPALGASTARGVLIRTAGQLSNVALFAVGLVLATGVFNTLRGTGGSLDALTGSEWGRVLLAKLALVALALALGGFNRMMAMPELRRSASTGAARRFVNVLHLEALVMMAVLVIAAVLGHSVPGYVLQG
ncbi:Copper resistance protein D [Paraburkholderia tropica]|uniref:CopD family protein n=1 Tax=Paraburkholderia TaxID=1822464 RepID=UPI001CB1C179|nr:MULTISPECIES: CopD family protein [Paraburkholderia]CAG9236580.1 Copper resistance protein D [Paraburkholderia tropica]